MRVARPDPAPAAEDAPPESAPSDLRLTRADLIDRAGLDERVLVTLEQYGLIAERPGGGYDADALEIAAVAALLGQYGLEARHLRAYRAAADFLDRKLKAEPPETKREWGRKLRMSDEVVRTVTDKWPRLGLPGTGKPIWK